MTTPPRITLRKRASSLGAPPDLAAAGRTALTLRKPAAKGARTLLSASEDAPIVIVAPSADAAAPLKARIAELEARLAAAEHQLVERAQREARVAGITLRVVDNRALDAAKRCRRATPPRVAITFSHVDVA
ncbi:MAG: hypothetical protein ACO1TE_29245 [Prosthecobacter sp.]